MSKAESQNSTPAKSSNVIDLAERIKMRIGNPTEPAFRQERTLSGDLNTLAFQILTLANLIKNGFVNDRSRMMNMFTRWAISAKTAELRAQKLEHKLRQALKKTRRNN